LENFAISSHIIMASNKFSAACNVVPYCAYNETPARSLGNEERVCHLTCPAEQLTFEIATEQCAGLV